MSKPIVDVGIRIDISDQIQDLERQLDSLSNRAGSKMTKGMADQVASIQQAIKELQAQFNSINTNKLNRKTFEDLSKGLIKQIDSIDQRTTALEQEMAALVGTMSKHVGDAFKKDLDSFSRSMATTTQNAKEAVGAIDHLYSTFNKTPNVKAHTGIDDSALEKEYKKLTSIMQIIDDINQNQYNDNPYMGSTKKLAQTLDDLTKEYLRLEDALKAPDLPIEEYNKFTLELAKTAKKIEELQYNAADEKYSDVFTLDFSGMKLQDITGRIEETLDKLSERIHDRLEEIKRQSAGITDTISAEIEKKSNGASETKRLTVPLDISTGVNTLVQRAKEIVDKTQPHLNDYPLKLQFVLQSGYSSKKTNKLLSQMQSEIDSLPEQVDKSGLRELFDSIAKDFSGDKELNIKIKANALSETEANINNTIKKIRTTVEKPMEIHPSVVMDEKVTKKLQRELNRLSKELVLDVKTINLFGKNQKGFDEVKTIVSVIDMIMSKAEETKLQTTYVWQVLVDIREILKTFSLQENIAEVKTLVDTLSDFLASIQTAYKVLSANDLDNMFAGIQQRVQNISGALRGNNLKEIKSVLTQFEQYQKLGGTKSFKDLGGADNIQGWLSRNAKEIEGAKDWYEAGTDFAQGYVKGIQDQIPNVEEAARKMVEAALAAVQAAQDSHSAAKETEKLGNDFGAGQAKGIVEQIPAIKKAAEEAAKGASQGWSEGMAGAADNSLIPNVAPAVDEIKDAVKDVADTVESSIDNIEERLTALLSGKRVSSKKLNELLGYDAYPIYRAGRNAKDSNENIAKVLLQHATTLKQTSNAEETFQSSLNETQEEIDETATKVEKTTKHLDAMTAAIGRLTSKSGSYNVGSIKEVLDGITVTGTTKRGHTVRDNARRSLQTEAEWINNNKFEDTNWENAYKHYLKFIQLFDIYKKNGGTKETLAKYQAYYDRIIGNADTMRTSLTNLLSKLPTDTAAQGFKEVEQASEVMGNEAQQEIKATAEEVTKLLVALQLAKKAMLDLSKSDGVTGNVHKKMGIDEYYYDPKSKTTELTDSELALKEAIKTMNEAIVNLRRAGITLFNDVPKIINNSGASLLSDSSLRNLYSLGKHDKNVSLIANAIDKYRDTGDQEILKYIQDLASKTKFSKFKKLNGSGIKKELLSNINNILNPSEEKASVKMTQEASASLDELVSKSQKASKATSDVSASQKETTKSTEKLTAKIKEQTSVQKQQADVAKEAITERLGSYSDLFVKAKDALSNSTDASDLKKIQKEVLAANNEIWQEINDSPAAAQQSWGMFFDNFKSFGTKFGMLYNDLEDRLLVLSVTSQTESKKTVAKEKEKQKAIEKTTATIKEQTDAAQKSESSIDEKFNQLKAYTSKHAKPRANAEQYPAYISKIADQYQKYVQAGGTKSIEELSKSKTVVADITTAYEKAIAIEKERQKVTEKTTASIKKQSNASKASDKSAEQRSKQTKQHTSEVAKNTEEIKKNIKASKEKAELSIDENFDKLKDVTSKYAKPRANAERYPEYISKIVGQYRIYEQAGGTKPISELTKSKTVLADLTAEYKRQTQEAVEEAKKVVDAEEKKQSATKKTTATIKEQASENKKAGTDNAAQKKTKQTAQHTSEVAKNTEEIKKNTQAAKENAEVSIDKKFDDLKALTSKYAKPRANAEKYPSVIATLAKQYRQYVQAGGTRPIEDLSKSKTVVADLTAEYEKQTQKIDKNTKSKKNNSDVESKEQADSAIKQTSLQIDAETESRKKKTDAVKESSKASKDESKATSESVNQTKKATEAENERRRALDDLVDAQEQVDRVYKNEIHNANGSVTATHYEDYFRTVTTTSGYDKDGNPYYLESSKQNYLELEKQIQRNDKAISQLTKDMILNAHAGADLSAWQNRIDVLEEYNRVLLKIRNNDWVGTDKYLPKKFHAKVFDAERLKAQEKDWETVIAAAQKRLKEYVSETESIASKPIMSGLKAEVTDLQSAIVALSGTQIDFKNPNIDIVRQQVVDFLITLTKLEDKLGDVRNKSSQNSFIPVDISEIKTQANNIQAFLDNNTAAGRKSKEVLNAVYDELRRIIDTGDEIDRVRFNALIGSAQDAEAEVRRLHQTGNSFFRSFTKQLKSANAQFFATYFSLMDIIRYIREVATTVTEVDSALTELRKVSDASTERLAQNFETSAATAKELGSSITHVINVTADWARLGYDVDAAEELARVTTLFQNVGDNMSADDASSFMISTLQGFQLATEQAEHIVDVYNEVANNFAIDTAGIGEALTRSAASFYAANTSLEKSVALVTATNEVVQNPEAVGTLWKTLSARIRGAKTELAELGEEEDEFTQTTSKLRDLVKGLTGFEIMADEDTFKDVYEIILGIGEKWNDLTDIEQASLGEALAGKRNANALYAVLNNLDTLESAYKHAQESSESAAREQENYMMSIQYSLDRFTASLQELEADFLSSDLAKKIVDFGTSFINTLDEIIEHSNAFVDILGVIGVVLGIKNHQAIIGAIKDLAQFGREMQVAGRASAELPAVLAGIQANGLEITAALGSAGPIILGIAAAVGVAIVAYDAFTVSVKESQKKIDEYNDSIKTLTSELDELRALENKTSYDNKRIEYLEKQLDIQKRLLEVEQQRYYLNLTEKSFGNAFDSDNIATQQARDADNFQNRNSTASTIRDVEKYVDRLTEIQQEIDSLNTDFASASTEKEQNKILAKIEKLENERKRIESGNGYDRYSALLDKYQLYVGQEEQLVAALTAKTESGQNMLTGKARDDAIAELDFARGKIKEITEAVRTYEITINGFDPFNAISGIKSEDVYNETEIIKAVNSTDSLENAQKRLVAQFPFLSALCTKYGLTLEELVAHYWEAKEAAEAAADEETKRANTLSTAVSNMNTRILPQFDALEKVYDEIFNGEKAFDLSQIGTDDLESIRSTFEDLDESLNIDWGSKTEDVDKFLSVIGNSSSTATEVHDAFDALATSYFNAAVASGDFTEENAKVLEQMLTEMGVVNAKEVVDYYQALADGEELATTKGIDLATVTSSEVDELIAEGEVAPITGKALALLALQKQLAAGITFGEDGNIDEIEALAKAAGAGAIYLSKLAKAKEIAAQVDAGNYGRIPELEALTQELETHDFTKDVKIDFSSVGGGTNAAGSAGSDAGDAYVEAFEKELKALEEQRDAGIITEKEFLDKYKALIEKYFKDVDGYGEEYAKRMGDYFQRAISYYESIFSAVGTLLDHRINAAQEGKDAAIDALNEEKDAALEAYDAQLEAIDDLIDAKQDQLDQLQEEHEARQRNINLQKAQYELEKAQNQRTKLIYKGGQLVYENDKSAVRDAKENVENAEYENAVAAIEKEIKALEDQREEIEKNREAAEKYYTKLIEDTEKYWDSIIEALEKQKSKWEELAEIKEIANAYALIQEAGESLGYSVEDILNDVPGAFEAFRDAYIGILQDANSENSNFLDGLSYATSTAKESVNSALGEIAGKASEVDKALEPLGEVSTKVEDTATALGNVATNSGTAASNVSTLSSNLDSVAGTSEDMSKIDSSVQSIASASLGDTVQSFKDLAAALQACAKALGIGDGEISALESAITTLSQVSLGDESTGAIGAFNALAAAVGSVTTAIGAAGSGEEGGDLTGSSSESMSAGAGGSGGLISAIEDVKEAADQYIGTTSSAGSEGGKGEGSGEEGGGTAISDFDALYKAVGNVIKALGNPEDDYSEGGEDGGTLVNAMKGLPIVGEESIRGDAGVIAMFTELLEIISQCAEKASELLASIRALGESGGAGLLGQDYTGNVHINAHANGNVHGNAYASGRLGLKKSENALVGELGQELVFNPATGTYRTVGDHGPEITRLSKGDLIFNAEQTKAIIKHGKHGGNSYANGSGLMPLSDAEKNMFKTMGEALTGIKADTSQMLDAARNIVQNINKVTTNNISPTINISGTQFTVQGVNGEAVMRQIEQSFAGMVARAYQEAMT